MPIARLFVERYKKRHLAAQVRSANGLRGIFKFSEILGSPLCVYVGYAVLLNLESVVDEYVFRFSHQIVHIP